MVVVRYLGADSVTFTICEQIVKSASEPLLGTNRKCTQVCWVQHCGLRFQRWVEGGLFSPETHHWVGNCWWVKDNNTVGQMQECIYISSSYHRNRLIERVRKYKSETSECQIQCVDNGCVCCDYDIVGGPSLITCVGRAASLRHSDAVSPLKIEKIV